MPELDGFVADVPQPVLTCCSTEEVQKSPNCTFNDSIEGDTGDFGHLWASSN
jgi:hypothetical protein